ncbi:SH2 domain-containing adapter protein F-like isoform X2 [Saccostrea echinata]|uniref:SH2 domain-containing adapter protein F-like isoform X2 n=1 Tax=Saccostrea echinata TaxID=191078 RepID=UPI002A813005|nr:SH2 domain-containing adapter protein F-like isoform X2 [Saccostrea echinata]
MQTRRERSMKWSANSRQIRLGKIQIADIQSDEVSLGDYTLPPDKRMEHLKGIPGCSSTEYTEPYETTKLLKAIRRDGGGNRKSSPLEEKSGVYSLAKSVSAARPQETKVLYRTLSDPAGGITDEGNPSQDYDHLSTWRTKETVSPKSQNSPKSPRSPSGPVIPQYEDPWDSKGKQQHFNQICEKAEIASRNSQPTSPASPNKSRNRMDVYEDAWDSDFQQKLIEARVQEARRASESRPKGRYEYEEPVSSSKTSVRKLPSVGTKNTQNDGQVYMSNYEQPWDSKEKEQELEEKFSRVGLSGGQRSPGSPPPPDFAPPPPPQAYEDAWDIRPQSKIISQVSLPNRTPEHPPPRRTSSPPLSKAMAEPIDPKLPLDIQKFYHGGITRRDAEELLVIHKEGSYLVRRSETQKNVFSLSLKGIGGIPMHLRISLLHGEYVLGENSQPFPTVPEMVDYYTRHNLPVQNASHIKLLHPIARPRM